MIYIRLILGSYQFEFSISKTPNKAHIVNHKKKMILFKKDIFIKLKNFNVRKGESKKSFFEVVYLLLFM